LNVTLAFVLTSGVIEPDQGHTDGQPIDEVNLYLAEQLTAPQQGLTWRARTFRWMHPLRQIDRQWDGPTLRTVRSQPDREWWRGSLPRRADTHDEAPARQADVMPEKTI
jgi:hypothetical protein